MSQDIIDEVYFFAGSVGMGVFITFVYDFILIGRRIVKHNLFFISLEDFVFWAACAIGVFYMLYEENNGILRWFAVLGAAFGMLLYKKMIGTHFVRVISLVIEKQMHIVKRIVGILLKPFVRILKRAEKSAGLLQRKERKLLRYIKKKLTGFVKMLKITVCKH